MSPELNPERPVTENSQQPGIFEKINNATRTRLAIAGIALSAAVGSVELSRSSEAGAAPAPEATASSLKDTCVQAGLARPEVKNAIIIRAGVHRLQRNIYSADYPNLPPQCKGKFKLGGVGMFQAKAPGDKNWRSMRGYWSSIYNMNRENGSGGFEEWPNSHGKPSDQFYLRGNERARIVTKTRVVNKKGKPVAEKTRVIKAEISRKKGPITIEW